MTTNNRTNKSVLCIGEAMLELSLSDSKTANLNYAGDTLNTAVYLQRLGSGSDITVAYCTVVGQDTLSDRLVDYIRSEDIDVSTIQRTDNHTIGVYAINTDDNGERSFTYWRNESAARTLFQHDDNTDFNVLENFDVIYLSAITIAILPANIRNALLEKLSCLRQTKDIKLAFDSNYRPALWESKSIARSAIASFWQITDIALPSIDDEQALFDDPDEEALVMRLKSYGIDQGALKRGETGPLSLTNDASSLSQQLTPVNVVDTTAAGDSFNAGYLSALLKGATPINALEAGHQCAARVITHRGAIIPKTDW